LHLVGVGSGILDHWLWDGVRWQSDVPLGLPWSSQQASPVEMLAATVNKQGKMMVVFADTAGEGDVAGRGLRYSTRTLVLPEEQTTTQEAPTPTLLRPTLTPATPALAGSSTPANSLVQTDRTETNDQTSPLVIALVPVALLLLGVLGIVMRQVARSRD
jgi:hypothetical protein